MKSTVASLLLAVAGFMLVSSAGFSEPGMNANDGVAINDPSDLDLPDSIDFNHSYCADSPDDPLCNNPSLSEVGCFYPGWLVLPGLGLGAGLGLGYLLHHRHGNGPRYN